MVILTVHCPGTQLYVPVGEAGSIQKHIHAVGIEHQHTMCRAICIAADNSRASLCRCSLGAVAAFAGDYIGNLSVLCLAHVALFAGLYLQQLACRMDENHTS